MKPFLFFTIFYFFIVKLNYAQVKNPNNSENPVFALAKISTTKFSGKMLISIGGELGLPVHRNLLLGIDGNIILPFSGIQEVLPGRTVYLYGLYGGLSFEPVLNPHQKYVLSFPVIIGGGLLGYFSGEGTLTNEMIRKKDLHRFVTPGISLQTKLNNKYALGLTYGYRYARRISLTGVNFDAFDGHNISLFIKKFRFFK